MKTLLRKCPACGTEYLLIETDKKDRTVVTDGCSHCQIYPWEKLTGEKPLENDFYPEVADKLETLVRQCVSDGSMTYERATNFFAILNKWRIDQ